MSDTAFTGRKEYGNSSIDTIEGADRVRKMPNVMLGSSGIGGAMHTVREIIGNALDEIGQGYGRDLLEISITLENVIRVRDYGRGVPLGFNPKKNKWNHFLIFEELYAGGKYDSTNDVLKNFANSVGDWNKFRFEDYDNIATVGQHGIGAAATQCSSSFCEVRSYDANGVCTEMHFKEGVALWEEPRVTQTEERQGTEIVWQPDPTVFTDINISNKWMRGLARGIAMLAEVTVIFTGKDGIAETFPAQNIQDEVRNTLGSCGYERTMMGTVEKGVYLVCETKAALGPSNGSHSNLELFQNYIGVSDIQGSNAIGANAAIADFFNSTAKDRGIKFKPDDFRGLISGIVSSRANKTNYEGQTKAYLENTYIEISVYRTVTTLLSRENSRGAKWLTEVLEKAVMLAESRMEREEARKQVAEITKNIRKSTTLPDKFVSCQAYEKGRYHEVELWVGEGDSATNSLVPARDSKTQAILPLRGKNLNLFKASLTKILNNAEVAAIIQILGAGVDLGAGMEDTQAAFDMAKLRIGKFIVCSDADIDGYHIRMLVTVLVWRLFPQIIKEGMFYIAESPLFIVPGKTQAESKYFYTDAEWDEWKEKTGYRGPVTRAKGLGQVNAVVLHNSTMNPATRRLVQVKFDPADPEINDVMEVLFGTSTDTRKRTIMSSMMKGINYDDLMSTLNTTINDIESKEFDDDLQVETVTYN